MNEHPAPESILQVGLGFWPSKVLLSAEMANHRLYGHWNHLTEALRTGLPQNEIRNGASTFKALYADPARLKLFLEAMTGVSHGGSMAIASKFPWAGCETFADAGTAQRRSGGPDRAGRTDRRLNQIRVD